MEKNMKQKFILALFLAAAIFIGAPRADAELRVTIKNNRSHTLTFAFFYDAANDDGFTTGWYNVKAGESRTITVNKDVPYRISSSIGYYATGGGKVWQGSSDNGRRRWIDPNNAFTHNADKGSIKGGKQVYFRIVRLTEGSNELGSTTLTFNP